MPITQRRWLPVDPKRLWRFQSNGAECFRTFHPATRDWHAPKPIKEYYQAIIDKASEMFAARLPVPLTKTQGGVTPPKKPGNQVPDYKFLRDFYHQLRPKTPNMLCGLARLILAGPYHAQGHPFQIQWLSWQQGPLPNSVCAAKQGYAARDRMQPVQELLWNICHQCS